LITFRPLRNWIRNSRNVQLRPGKQRGNGLVWRNWKKTSHIINEYLYLPFLLSIILLVYLSVIGVVVALVPDWLEEELPAGHQQGLPNTRKYFHRKLTWKEYQILQYPEPWRSMI
jgi:hypothetical protein